MAKTIIKALSVKQPWANMIASGRKTIETRTWATRYRGPILILSSLTPRIDPAGCAVAVADLVDCRPMTIADEAAACCAVYPRATAWVLANIRPVKPFGMKGRLGLFTVQVEESLLQPSMPRDT